jgi:hypothetical protein
MLSLQRLENIFRLLLPPASREHVLGDLHEKCKSRRQYFIDAASVLGPVIISRIRRTTDFQVFLMETFAVYLSLSATAWLLGQKAFLYDQAGFLRLAIPTAVTVTGLLICNAYSDPGKQVSWIKPILQSAGSLSVAFLGQAVIFDTRPSFAVPFGVMLYGSCTSLVLVSSLRTLFPPILSGGSRVALLNEPRNSPKPNHIPEGAIFQRARQSISHVKPPHKVKTATALAVLLCAVALLVATMYHAVGEFSHFAVIAVIVLIFCTAAKHKF